MPVESPDLNTYLYLEQQALSKIARAIGQLGEANTWSERAAVLLEKMMQALWDPAAGYFWFRKLGVRIDVRTPFNLFPLQTGNLPPEVVSRLIDHLTNPREFWSQYPVPSVAQDDPAFNPIQMWRGPTWVNVNYLLIYGLRRSGYPELAADLRQRTLQLICNDADIYEYYRPDTGQNPPEAASVFGWSSALFIDLVLQDLKDSVPDERGRDSRSPN